MKKRGRPRGRVKAHRPVIGARIPQALYDEIKAAAAAACRTKSEELVWRAKIYAERTNSELALLDECVQGRVSPAARKFAAQVIRDCDSYGQTVRNKVAHMLKSGVFNPARP